jgi:hypothetical protein
MVSHIVRAFITAVSMALIMVVWIASPGELQGQTLYRYIDKDGSSVLTDNPPPGVKAKRIDSLPESTESIKEDVSDQGKETDVKAEKPKEAEAKKKDKRGEIESLREEIAKSESTAQQYRSNMNQSHGFAQRRYWRNLLDEQEKDIEEKKKKLEELENSP